MSFSSETKNELARIEPERKCCQLAEIAGFLRVSGSIRLTGGGKFQIVVTTDSPAVARHYKKMLQEYFRIEAELLIGEAAALKKGHTYMLTIDPEMRSESILRETGILLVREGNNYISDGIYDGIVKTRCCRKAYLRGIFLGTGSVNSPEKGYHLEFVCGSENLARDLRRLINTFDDLSAKITQRKDRYVVYMKNSQYISDTLAIMGAHSKVLEYEDVKIKKELVNQAVRMTNCDTANTDRTLDASQRQLEAIRRIERTGGLDALPPKLRELALLRQYNPEASLTQLGEMMSPPLKKSGVNNRMKRILDFAAKL
ncbi:DNA-binding protein WhiA [Hornefia porci]|uniref:Probable cell division protein WhiA n=1 Tax=Hornefia porci TaxID=2652292 RepID=A0A1Q9JK39_9FIRM|nr:DNA-binding protein WhiA [Hornefia porci]OLR56521.1 DNA-binding protein WhiA [Hornefia porci]